MTPETNIYYEMLVAFVASGLIWILMLRQQKRKQKAADEQFEFTMKMIELRNKKIKDDK
jgi:preprotein translocase subunit YajC